MCVSACARAQTRVRAYTRFTIRPSSCSRGHLSACPCACHEHTRELFSLQTAHDVGFSFRALIEQVRLFFCRRWRPIRVARERLINGAKQFECEKNTSIRGTVHTPQKIKIVCCFLTFSRTLIRTPVSMSWIRTRTHAKSGTWDHEGRLLCALDEVTVALVPNDDSPLRVGLVRLHKRPVRAHVCACVRACVSARACACLCVRVRVCVRACFCACFAFVLFMRAHALCVRACVRACMHACMWVRVRACARACVVECVRVYV